MAVLLACKKKGVKSVGEPNVFCHKVEPVEMMGIKKKSQGSRFSSVKYRRKK